MNSELLGENILFRVKEQLLKEKIKLWLDPYYDSVHGVSDDEEQAFQLLSEQIMEQLNISQEQCLFALKTLQTQALNRLEANKAFKESGVASLNVKVSGELRTNVTIKIMLTASTAELTQDISNEIGIPCERLKLICNGRVLKGVDSLADQGVKNGSHLMAVVLADTEQIDQSEKRFKQLESTKRDVDLLAGGTGSNYLQIENQSGELVTLPPHERKSLLTAMALHEKGRAALKKEDYPLALIYFLEADKEYSDCRSQLLEACDNYALLHLDVAWCYLCLRNAAQIPDAERRLSLCEHNFHKSYGPNLERLTAIKGTTGNEQVLFMRLHLLQGVVFFHQNRRAEAKILFERAQSELNSLKVDDKKVTLLMEFGFTSAEARLGLRAARGNIEAAEEHIQRKRKEKELAQEKNRTKLKFEKEHHRLGLCKDGQQYVDPQSVGRLQAMGFSRHQCVEALRLSNNVISEAVTLIQEQPHLLPTCSLSEESVAQVVSLGFDQDLAREALASNPQLERAVRSLSSILGLQGSSSSTNTLSNSISAMSILQDFSRKRKARQEEEIQAYERISQDILTDDSTEDHLDFNLVEEEQFLVEYLSLLH